MDVQVKLLLRGGHVWDFCCDEDDPIVFGLVSSLSDPGVDGHVSPDGLVQVESRTGRFFIARSSLIAVEIIPIIDELQNRSITRFALPSAGFTGGLCSSAPFALVASVMPNDVHGALVELALGQDGDPLNKAGDVRLLDIGIMSGAIERTFNIYLEKCRLAFDLVEDHEAHLDCRMYAVGDAQSISMEGTAEDVLSLVYHFHNQPKVFTGGGIRLFDRQMESGMCRATDTFRDLEIKDNALVIFPSGIVSAGLPVRCPTLAFADGLFVICCTLRRGLRRD